MPRQKKCRRIENPPILSGYKPIGISSEHLDVIRLHLEEYEAIRLADYENHRHEAASRFMEISRPTFTRIYNSARKKIAQAFVEGKEILFEGGYNDIDSQWYKCNDCNEVFKLTKDFEKKCTTCMSENIENLKENQEHWQEEQDSITKEKELVTCVSCGYVLRTNRSNYPCPQCGNRMRVKKTNNSDTNKKVAIPVEAGHLCSHFGGAKYFDIYEIENNQIIQQETLEAPKHVPGILPKWLGSMEVTDILAGGMGQRAIKLLEQYNISAHTGIAVDTIENVLKRFLDGTLEITFAECTHNLKNKDCNHQ